MSDDIDIEEYDLLQNPSVLAACPDLSNIKREVDEDAHEEENCDTEDHQLHYQYCGGPADPSPPLEKGKRNPLALLNEGEPITSSMLEDDCYSPSPVDGDTPSSRLESTAPLVKASRPDDEPGSPRVSAEKDEWTSPPLLDGGRSPPAHRPSASAAPDSTSDLAGPSAGRSAVGDARVCLQDCGPFLDDGECFCVECGTLFPTENALAAHDMAEHSFLTAVSGRPPESPLRRSETAPALRSHVCPICEEAFPSNARLVSHLAVHFRRSIHCDFCEATFAEKKFLERHLLSHARVRHGGPSGPLSARALARASGDASRAAEPAPPAAEDGRYECPVCAQFFVSGYTFGNHMRIVHGRRAPLPPRTRPRTACAACPRVLRSVAEYNLHVRSAHVVYTCPVCRARLVGVSALGSHRSRCRGGDDLKPRQNVEPRPRDSSGLRLVKRVRLARGSHTWHHVLHARRRAPAEHAAPPRCETSPAKGAGERGGRDAEAREGGANGAERPRRKGSPPNGSLNKSSPAKGAKGKGGRAAEAREKTPNIAKRQHPKVSLPSGSRSLTLLRCGACKAHIKPGRAGPTMHSRSDCTAVRLRVCRLCGLTFTNSSAEGHADLHRTNGARLTMASFTILRVADLRPVGREPCPFPSCERCGLLVAGASHRSPASCANDGAVDCTVCRLSFAASAFRLHVGYYGCDSAADRTSAPAGPRRPGPSGRAAKRKATDDGPVTSEERRTRLYACRDCDAVVDDYTEVVRHCERHRARVAETPQFVCHVCDLRFLGASFARHKQLHLLRPGLERSRFEVLEYRPELYGTRAWLAYECGFTGDLLAGRVLQPGPERHTLYRCSACRQHCDGRVAASRHATRADGCPDSPLYCSDCRLPMEPDSLVAHAAEHTAHAHLAAAADFRIVSFGDAVRPPRGAPPAERAKVPLYKCDRCDAHFVAEYQAKHHNSRAAEHHSGRHLRSCDGCSFTFTNVMLNTHRRLHHEQKNLKRCDFRVETVGRTVKRNVKRSTAPGASPASSAPSPTLLRCVACGLHFLEKIQSSKHWSRNHRPGITRPMNNQRLTCVSCGLEFSRKLLAKHRRLHHRNVKRHRADFTVLMMRGSIVVGSAPTEPSAAVRAVGPKQGPRVNIKKIALKPAKTVPCGRNMIRVGSASARRAVSGTAIRPKPASGADTTTTVGDDHFTVYRCTVCRLCFLARKTLDKHVARGHRGGRPRSLARCDRCDLPFTRNSLSRHEARHHRDGRARTLRLVESGGRPADYGALMAAYERRGAAALGDEHLEEGLEVDDPGAAEELDSS